MTGQTVNTVETAAGVFDGPTVTDRIGGVIRAKGGAPHEAAPRRALIVAPSPIQRLVRLERALGAGVELYMKRDDAIRPLFGNKLRYIEYVFGALDALGADCVVHCGGASSNYLVQLAMAGAAEGVPIHLAVAAARDVASLNNPRLAELFGATVHYAMPGSSCSALKAARAAELAAEGRRPLVIDAPFTNHSAILAYMRASDELLTQVDAGVTPMPDHVLLCSVGNSYLGLRIGTDLAGARIAIKAFAPIRFADAGLSAVAADRPSFLAKKRREFEAFIGRTLAQTPLDVDETMVGPGYGVPSADGVAAVRLLAETEGVLLDPIYTGKAMAGLLHGLRAGTYRRGARVLFLHSGGFVNVFAHHVAFLDS